jgi:anti-sigma factor RsiW
MSHLDDESLSALMDQELPAPDSAAARTHLAACAECRARLASFQAASDHFRKVGFRESPAHVGQGAKIRAVSASRPRRFLAVGVASLAVILAAGLALKSIFPALFFNFSQMITGAATSMGSSGK